MKRLSPRLNRPPYSPIQAHSIALAHAVVAMCVLPCAAFGFTNLGAAEWEPTIAPAAAQWGQELETSNSETPESIGNHTPSCAADPRLCIEVEAYDLDLDFTRAGSTWTGEASISLRPRHGGLQHVVLDAGAGLDIRNVRLMRAPGREIKSAAVHIKERLIAESEKPFALGQELTLVVKYRGDWKQSGGAWLAQQSTAGLWRMDTALQYSGAHHLFPCKASFYNPGDKPQRSTLRMRIPSGLRAIGPGARTLNEPHKDGSSTVVFELQRAAPTWTLGFAIGPFEVRKQVWRRSTGAPLDIELYSMPDHREASSQILKESPLILSHLEDCFGSYPYAQYRLALVETLNRSTANATWVGIGSDLIASDEGLEEDPHEHGHVETLRVLSHELGHAWWGSSLSASSWRDAWLHESFASYGELSYLGEQQGEERQRFAWQHLVEGISPKARLAMCGRAGKSAATASNGVLWFKGPWVLRALAFEIGDDATWKRCLHRFQSDYRFGVASTKDLQAILEEETGRPWQRFFDEWFEGRGYPRVHGTATVSQSGIELRIQNLKDEQRSFHVPIDISWLEGKESLMERVLLQPGSNVVTIPAKAPRQVDVRGLDNILGIHRVTVKRAKEE